MKNETIKVGFVGHGGIARSLYTEIYGNLAEIAQVVAVEAIEDLKNELSNYPKYVSQQDQSRLSVESIINDSEPLVPIEIPHHYVELTRAIYKSSEDPPLLNFHCQKTIHFIHSKADFTELRLLSTNFHNGPPFFIVLFRRNFKNE